MNFIRRLPLPGILAAGLGLFLIGPAHADSFVSTSAPLPPSGQSIQLLGAQNFTWDSNPLLLSSGQKSLFGSTTVPEFILTDSTPTAKLSADTTIDENLYNQSAFDSTDLHEKLSAAEQMQQWGAGINAAADRDTVRTSELTTFNVSVPKIRHTGLSVSPTLSFDPTAVDKLSITGFASKSNYDNSIYKDYKTFSLTPAWAHSFDPLNTGTFTFLTQRYETTEGPAETVNTMGPSVGWVALLTPRLTLKLSGGIQRSVQNTQGFPSLSSWDYVFSNELIFKGQQDTLDVSASRSQYPFENGTETVLTAFSVNESHALNEKFSLNASGSYQFAKQPADASGISLDSQYSASAGITYHLLRQLDLNVSYQYKDETLNGVTGSINDQMVLLGLSYHPMAKAL